MPVLLHIIERHADELASLWDLRQHVVRAHHFAFRNLWDLDRRIEANVEGLALAGDEAWPICRQQLGLETAGDAFAHSVVALHTGRADWLSEVLEGSKVSPPAWSGLVAALGWVSLSIVKPRLDGLLAASDPHARRLGLAGAAAHRHDVGEPLRSALQDDAPSVRAEALRAAGELGLSSVESVLRYSVRDLDPQCRFWAAWSSSLLAHNPEALAVLLEETEASGPRSQDAMRILARRLSLDAAQRWVTSPSPTPAQLRIRIMGAGAHGAPQLVPWLVAQMDPPATARLAGESFATLTGVVLDRDELQAEPPAGLSSGPTDDPNDDNVEVDLDADLPWPSAEKVGAFWNAHGSRFASGARYFLGLPITAPGCKDVLRNGRQEHRAMAAIALALLQPGPLFPVAAPAHRQWALLAST